MVSVRGVEYKNLYNQEHHALAQCYNRLVHLISVGPAEGLAGKTEIKNAENGLLQSVKICDVQELSVWFTWIVANLLKTCQLKKIEDF